MKPREEIVEKWIARMTEFHPEQSAALRAPEPDPFRNPVAYTVRKSLAELWEQLCGDMDPDAIDSALDAVIRIRAVQDISPREATGFVVQLQPLLSQLPAEVDRTLLEARINRLALTALEKYKECRKQIAALRVHEVERLTHGHGTARKARA